MHFIINASESESEENRGEEKTDMIIAPFNPNCLRTPYKIQEKRKT